MSLANVTVDVPATGEGLVADISALVGAKTVTLTGRFRGSYTLLASHNDVNFVPVLVFNSDGVESIKLTLPDAYKSVRLRSRATALGPVTMSVKGVSLAGENLFATLATFLAGTSGTSAVFDLATLFPPTGLEEGVNLVCEGGLVGNLLVEGSQDNVAYNPVGSFQGGQFHRALTAPLEFTPLSTGDQVRYLRFVLQGQAASDVVLTIGGRIPVGGGAGLPMPIFASVADGTSFRAEGSPSTALGGANITVLGQTHTIGAGCTSLVIGGANNTIAGGNTSCVVIGVNHALSGGCSSSIVTGAGNTLGGGCSNTIVSGVGNTLSASGSNNTVLGAGNVVNTSSSQVSGAGNTLNAGTSNSQVVGVSCTLVSGASTSQVMGVSCSVGEGSPNCQVKGVSCTIGAFSPNTVVVGSSNAVAGQSNLVVLIGSSGAVGTAAVGAVSIGSATVVGDNCAGAVTVGRATAVRSAKGLAVGDGATVPINAQGSSAIGSGAVATVVSEVIFDGSQDGSDHGVLLFHALGHLNNGADPFPDLLRFEGAAAANPLDSGMFLFYRNTAGTRVSQQVKVQAVTGLLYVPV